MMQLWAELCRGFSQRNDAPKARRRGVAWRGVAARVPHHYTDDLRNHLNTGVFLSL